MKHVKRFLSQLRGVTRSGKEWKALCPCPEHNDKTPSLSINTSEEDRRILVWCFGGCTKDAILEALGVDDRDLWPQPGDLDDVEDADAGPDKPAALDPALCHEVYAALLSRLSLSDPHRQQLRERGLTDELIDRNGYRSLSFFEFRNKAVAALREQYGERLLKVPGFTTDNGKVTAVQLPNGILIPVRDLEGRVVAMQVRSDSGDPKYRWLSGGTVRSGSPAHIPLGTTVEKKGIRVTEGPLKADIAFALDGIPTMGVAGVTGWPSALPVLEALGVTTVRLAFDADAHNKRGVAQALADFTAALRGAYAVQVDTWSPEQGKGLDDLLRAGHRPTKLIGDDAVAHVRRLLELNAGQGPQVEESAAATGTEAEPPPAAEPAPEQATAPARAEQAASLKGPAKFPYGSGDPVPFPLDFFPEPLQEVVREISTAVNSPPDLAACAMVSAAATAIGRSRQLEPKEDWKICPRLYMGLVCDPGSGKTPALGKVMRPLWRKNHEWEQEYAQDLEVYEAEKMIYEASKKEFMKHVAKSTKQGRGRRRQDPEEALDADAFDALAWDR